jgi:S-adenosylmethionine:tRNA ribosyltransferase-isomerase
MPSAGRAFTPSLITQLVSLGIQIMPLQLHTGVASLESHEPPFAERFDLPEATADAVNRTRDAGRRVIAVGTSVVRVLETRSDETGKVSSGKGWTDLVISPDRQIRSLDGLITGFHEPEASHLAMLEAVAGRRHVERAYEAALAGRFLWHEFGDLHLILR